MIETFFKLHLWNSLRKFIYFGHVASLCKGDNPPVVVRCSSSVNIWTFLTSTQKPLDQFWLFLVCGILVWRGTEFVNLVPPPPTGPGGGAKTVKKGVNFQKSSLHPDTQRLNCLCDCNQQHALYQNCEIHGPRVKGLDPMGSNVPLGSETWDWSCGKCCFSNIFFFTPRTQTAKLFMWLWWAVSPLLKLWNLWLWGLGFRPKGVGG